MKSILVTGGGGYIGSILCSLLIEKGYQVIALDRFFFGKETLSDQSGRLTIIENDIRFIKQEVFKDVDAIIDLAALSNDPAGELDPIKTWSINHLGRLRIATLAKVAGVKRYIFPSSCSIYGFQEKAVDEASPVNPLTTYAKANYQAENDIMALASDSFCVVILRQATLYGYSPRMRFDLAINGMVKGFIKNGKIPILKDGNQWRPFVHVRDTSSVMMLCLEAETKDINRQIFNVGSDEQNYQIFNLAERVAKAMEVPFSYEWYGQPDHRSYQVRFDKVRKAFGYQPQFKAEDGTREIVIAINEKRLDPDDARTITVEWYKKLLNEGVMI